MLQRRVHADNLGIRFSVHQARKAVAGVAANTATLGRVLLVEHDAHRQEKRMIPDLLQVVAELLNAPLVADRRVEVRGTGWRFGRIDALLAMHLVEVFGLGVVGFEVLVADRPSR